MCYDCVRALVCVMVFIKYTAFQSCDATMQWCSGNCIVKEMWGCDLATYRYSWDTNPRIILSGKEKEMKCPYSHSFDDLKLEQVQQFEMHISVDVLTIQTLVSHKITMENIASLLKDGRLLTKWTCLTVKLNKT